MKLSNKTLIFWGFFLGIFLLRRLGVFSWSLIFLKNSLGGLISWLLGAYLGAQFIKVDQLLFSYLTYPNLPQALSIKAFIQQRKYGELWRLLNGEVDKQKSVFYSAIFQAVWVLVAFFALTSTTGYFGQAFVLAIGLLLLIEEWETVLTGKDLGWLFWQIKKTVSFKEQKAFLWIMTGIFVVLSLLTL